MEYNIMTKDVFNYMIDNFLSIDERNILRLLNKEYYNKYKDKINVKTLIINKNLGTLKHIIINHRICSKYIIDYITKSLKNGEWDIFTYLCFLQNNNIDDRSYYISRDKFAIWRRLKENNSLLAQISNGIDIMKIIFNKEGYMISEPYIISWIIEVSRGPGSIMEIATDRRRKLFLDIIKYSHTESLLFLCNIYNLILRTRPTYGDFAQIAVEYDRLDNLKCLLNNGFKLNGEELDYAIKTNKKDIIDYIIRYYS
ncbi:Ankyrin-repeat protein [Orpheovirus IHUMI-LCC2]|uniref:Ankyrin-repeat protein n=1 Tax=Orpheovirus IHUMI-LCC2 TaxID=2023057 RepID=A0A2I2L453_9VIRU|nr:Ankyrin-repeat protein [Orpheovirus IHUMI-LCC2]SNW62290.1 Ankyrin-repeat protein [Orpheovirus IHUMI-LCC2]